MKARGKGTTGVFSRRWATIATVFFIPFAALAEFGAFARPALGQSTTPLKSQEAVVAPNENLVVEGIPAIPAALAGKADRYTNFRTAIFTAWHPRGAKC
jgi:hypothetical protein